ncbi:MAG: hypothetical protein K5910_01250 [Bacteroidales bacterium]|nr:hypothetical protein [Bacteroidales bacterium]
MPWYLITGIVLLGVMLLVIVLQSISIVRYKRALQKYLQLIGSLERERELIDRTYPMIEDDPIRQSFARRALLISRLLAAVISEDDTLNESLFNDVKKLVSERGNFMQENLLLFEHWQPKMVRHLRECGLNDAELQICGLYALGLNGKVIQQYTRNGRHYQDVGLIRRKLGLGEHDRNIDGYIRSLMD